MKSLRFQLNKEDVKKILYTFLWSAGSALTVGVIALIQTAQFPPEIIWIVPALNTFLYAVKKWIDGKVAK
jgi:hypothetical protein